MMYLAFPRWSISSSTLGMGYGSALVTYVVQPSEVNTQPSFLGTRMIGAAS